MPTSSARLPSPRIVAVAGLALLASAGGGLAAAGLDASSALDAAHGRSLRAAGAVEALKAALSPGHLADPLPEVDRALGLDGLRAEVAEMQRRVAGYRATMGDQHPTVVGAVQVLGELRAQLLDATRRALTAAERDAAAARTEAAVLDRRAAARSGDTTGSTPPAPAARPRAPEPESGRPGADGSADGSVASAMPAPARDAAPVRVPTPARPAAEGNTPAAPAWPSGGSLIASAAALLAALLGASALSKRLAARRPAVPRSRTVRRVPPARRAPPIRAEPTLSVDPVLRPAPGVPVLARLSLPDPSAVADAVEGAPDGALVRAAERLNDTLRSAFSASGGDGRMTVLVSPLDAAHDTDGAALALALAAAGTGRRVLVMEARAEGRLRRTLAPVGKLALLIEAGGVLRGCYRIEAAGRVVAVLPSDAGEAEAARDAAGRADIPLLRGLDAFDTVVMVGAAGDAAPAPGADMVLLAASEGVEAVELAAAAARLRAGDGRPCGAMLVSRSDEPVAVTRGPRPVPPRTAAAGVGLRGSFEPVPQAAAA